MQFIKQEFPFCISFDGDIFGTEEENMLKMDLCCSFLSCITLLFHCDPCVSCLIQLLGRLFSEILQLRGKAFEGLVWQSSLIEYFWPSITQIECREPFPKKPNGFLGKTIILSMEQFMLTMLLFSTGKNQYFETKLLRVPVGSLDLGLSVKCDCTVSDCWLHLECLNITLFY